MIVFSFAWRRNSQSPCNIRLAQAAFRIAEGETESLPIVVAQRTTLAAMETLGVPDGLVFLDIHTIQKRLGYEGSEDVVEQAAKVFRAHGVTEVIPVAQPVLQLTKCVQLVRKAGFRTPSFWKLCRMIGWIGFDWQSAQPWTRDPVRLVFYTFRQVVFGYKPRQHLAE